MGICAEGHQGILCNDCKYGYAKLGGLQCKRCPNLGFNIFLICLIVFCVLIYIIVLVNLTIKSKNILKPLKEVYFKIFVNHFQIIAMVSTIDFQWPGLIK